MVIIFKGPAFPTFNQTFELVFESERVFRDFQSSSLTSFFRKFRKVWKIIISKISKVSKIPNFKELFQNFSELFPNFFQTFPKLFDPKTGFFDSKTQTLHTFFKIFKIYVHFQNLRIFSKFTYIFE